MFAQEILTVFWLFLPAAFANSVPVLVSKLPGLRFWNYPLDGYRQFRNKRIFGNNKTFRGLLLGTLAASICSLIQHDNVMLLPIFAHVPKQQCHPLFYGLITGFTALIGDSLKSFVKRQINIQEGRSFIPFDQIDFVLGGLLGLYFCIQLSLTQSLLLIIFWTSIHPFGSLIGYKLGLKSNPL